MEALEILPIDCWRSILNHLDDDDDGLQAVSLVCKDLLTISNSLKHSLKVVHPGIGMLSKLLKRFEQLKKINFREFRGDILNALLEIVRCDVSVDILEIDNVLIKWKTSKLLEKLDTMRKLRNLKTLNCGSQCCLSDNDLEVIANSFSNLEKLKIGNFSYSKEWLSVTDYGVEYLASKLKFLKKIRIDGAHKVSDQSLIALSLNCAFLKAVTIISYLNNGITENGIGLLLRNRPNLESLYIGLHIHSSRSTINIENSISHAKALTCLKIRTMEVSDMLLNTIAAKAKAKLLPLKKFELMFCRNFTVTGGLLMVSPYLTKLGIDDMDMEPFLQLFLNGDVGKLTHIEIGRSWNVTNVTLWLLSTKCPSLVDIKLWYSELDLDRQHDNIIPYALSDQNHNIQTLYLNRCVGIGDESVKQLAFMFPNLRAVDLSYCTTLTSTGIEAMLKNCKFITKLGLAGYNGTKPIEDDNISQVMINLEDLILTSSVINDEGLAAIAKRCRRLVSLNLNLCTNVTADGIKQIVENITTLTFLKMWLKHDYHGSRSDVLEWMLSTANFASLKEIYVQKSKEQRDKFLHHGCLLTDHVLPL